MNDALFAAYRNTSFYADTLRGRLCLRVGRASPEIDALLAAYGVRTWAYVTGVNPGSILLTPDENEERHQRLELEVRRRGYTSFPGEGIGDDDQWPPERSLLILGIGRDEAIRLGREFGQRAVVYGEEGGAAMLLPCDLSA
jgi:hypothetical protein